MVGRAVVALAVVFPDQFPIGLLNDGGLERNLGLMQLVRQKVRLDVPSNGLEVRRHLAQADPDIAARARAVDRFQAMLRFVEFTAHVARRNQAPVECVGPLMIGTHQPRRRPALGGTNPRSAMPASVVEGAQSAVAVAQDDDRILADLHRQEVPRVRHLAIVAHEQPIAVPDHVQIDLVILLTAIKFPLQRRLEITSPQSAQHGIARNHEASSYSGVGTIPTYHGEPVPRSDAFCELYDSEICADRGNA